MDKRTQKKYLEQLQDLKCALDIEISHIEADEILCKILKELGYTEIVKAYNKVSKWYV